MRRIVLLYGILAGLIVGVPLFGLTIAFNGYASAFWSMAVGYAAMLVALGMIFVAVKRTRDGRCAGAIAFWPALGIGIGITLVSSLFYVAAWELAMAATHMDFAGRYADARIAQRMETGASAAELARLSDRMERFKSDYANPLYRALLSFAEFVSVGVIVSSVTAALVSNPRFRPRRIKRA